MKLVDRFINICNDYPILWAIYPLALVIPLVLLLSMCVRPRRQVIICTDNNSYDGEL